MRLADFDVGICRRSDKKLLFDCISGYILTGRAHPRYVLLGVVAGMHLTSAQFWLSFARRKFMGKSL